jgi:hypothetical protein
LARKTWERPREIPERIVQEVESCAVSPSQVIYYYRYYAQAYPASCGTRADVLVAIPTKTPVLRYPGQSSSRSLSFIGICARYSV